MGIDNSQRDAMNAVFPPGMAAAIQAALGGAEKSINPDEFRRVIQVDIKVHTPDGLQHVAFTICPAAAALERQPYMGTAACVDQAHDMIVERFGTLMASLVTIGEARGESNTLALIMEHRKGGSDTIAPQGRANSN